MSADNGIYILETAGPEYRVREFQAVENISWDNSIGGHTSDDEVILKNARRMWHGCEVLTNRTDALVKADELLQKTDICEYGISFIKLTGRF